MRRARTAARAPATLANASRTTTIVFTAIAIASATVTQTPDSLSALGAILPPFVSQNFDELVKVASASCEVLPLNVLFTRSTSFTAPRTQLLEFTHDASRSHSVHIAHKRVHPQDTLVLYVPGWWNTPGDASSRAIVTSLMTKHSSVLLFDTRNSFCQGYISSVTNVTPLSYVLYGFIKNLHKKGFPVSSMHLIGFSLGAHVAGLTGKLVKRKLNATLGRITALDPARPCFSRTEYRLDKRDAKFVQVIHSSTGVLGLEEPLGHADVYVNGLQGKHPECQSRSISLECDHALAWKLYSASAINENTLMGRKCASWDELLQNECSGNETVLGYSCTTDAQGMFLYKSQEKARSAEKRTKELSVYNPLNLLRWPFSYWNS